MIFVVYFDILPVLFAYFMLFIQSDGTSFSTKSRLRAAASFAFEVVKIVVISLAIIIPVRYFLIQPFYVKGASMEPNFYNYEYLIIDEFTYRFTAQPSRGDIVVFHPPTDDTEFFIKRVVGLPGETVTIGEGKVRVMNAEYPLGVTLDESAYLPTGLATEGNQTVVLEPQTYFVLGDNRGASLDSRSFGPVTSNQIVGRALFRGWPFNRITVFASPQYNVPR